MVERIKPRSQEVVRHDHAGQPTKYLPSFARTCQFMAQRGATVAEMADACSVDTRTFYNWMNAHPELREAVDAGNDVFNPRVERALAERAIGYSVDEEHLLVVDGVIHRETIRKHYPPDVTAGIYFSKNRMPDRWRDVQRHEINATALPSSEELRQQLLVEFKDLVDQGLLSLPAPERKMKEINPRRNGFRVVSQKKV